MAQTGASDEVGWSVSVEDLSPFSIENDAGRGPAVIVVDHASNRFPAPWGDLGLSEADRRAHVAWDPGALGVAREMARRLDAPLIAGTVSRLIVDVNRPVGSPTFAPSVSEYTEVPGNALISESDMARRVAAIHAPYHAAVATLVERQAARAAAPVAVIAVHTFTPVYKGVRRDLQVGILFDGADDLGPGMLGALARDDAIRVAANEPYSPADEVYYTLRRHAVDRGLPAAMIEIRNDEVATPADEKRWGERLAAAVVEARAGLAAAPPLTAPAGEASAAPDAGRPPIAAGTDRRGA